MLTTGKAAQTVGAAPYFRAMKSLPIRLVVLLGVLSVVGIIAVQVYWVRRAYDNEERQLDQKLYLGLKNVATRLAAYSRVALPDQSPVNQLSSNYYVVNVNSEIDANLLDYYLRQEFGRLNLRLDYEYAIYDCGTDHMVYGNYVSAAAAPAPAAAPTRLPKYNRYTYYFGLHLPQRAPYFMSRLNGCCSWWWCFSGTRCSSSCGKNGCRRCSATSSTPCRTSLKRPSPPLPFRLRCLPRPTSPASPNAC